MRILLVQTSFLGDTVLSTPLIGALKELYPDSEVWMLTTPAGRALVERDPLLAGVLTFDKRGSARGPAGVLRLARELRSRRFDRVYSLHRSIRTAILLALAGIPHRVGFAEARGACLYHERRVRRRDQHDVLRNLDLVRPEMTGREPTAALRLFPPADAEVSEEVRGAAGAGGYVVLVPGSVWATKRWSWREYREVARELLARGERVVVVGAPDEVGVAEQVARGLPVVNLAGRTSVQELIWIISRAGRVVCNDSVALHIASARRVPTVAIFCATIPEWGFGPWQNERAVVLGKEHLPCRPCRRHGSATCPTGTELCMRGVRAAEVLAALGRIAIQRSEVPA